MLRLLGVENQGAELGLSADFANNIIKSVGSYGLVERNIGERSIDFNFGSQGGRIRASSKPWHPLPPPRPPFL